MFEKMGETYKVELIDSFPPDARRHATTRPATGSISCRGPHVDVDRRDQGVQAALGRRRVLARRREEPDAPADLRHRVPVARPSSTRYLKQLEEAKRRDHRRIGKDLDLFSIDETIGAGLVLWHPKGARVRHLIETFWREEHFANGYELVASPHIARDELWKTSGHLSFYKENMFSGMDIDGQQYIVKPMNCPFHCTIFKKGLRSYRELPHRWAELGTVYRYEQQRRACTACCACAASPRTTPTCS